MDSVMSRVEDTSIQLCRLCLRNTTGCISIFSDLYDSEDVELPKVVKNCVGVAVRRGDGFTCMVCGPCHKMVLLFHDFKTTCLESQWRLRNMPRRAAEGPRDPLEGTDEADVGRGPGERATGVTLRSVPSLSSGEKGDTSNKANSTIWPVAMWTVSEGCWRASTSSSDETIISDLLDDDNNSKVVDNRANKSIVDGGNGGTTPTCRSMDSPAPDPAYMDHTYSTRPTEPLQLCSVVMEHLEDDEEEIAAEDWGVEKEGGGKEKESSSRSSKLEKKIRKTHAVSVVVGNKSVGVVKEFADTTQKSSKEPDKLSNWKLLSKKNVSDAVQRIVIKGGSSVPCKVKHIPLVKGLRLTSGLMIPNGSQCSIVKMKKLSR